MMWLEAFLENWVLDAVGHFWLAFVLGVLAFWSIWIILYAPLSIVYHLRQSPMPRAAIYGMLALCLLLAFSFSLLSHAILDGFVSWWHTPLGPSLESIGG